MTEPLDRIRIADLLRASGQTEAAFLVELRRSVEPDVQLLLDASANADFTRVGQLAHRIEGAARMIGAGPLARACSVVARARDPGVLRSALAAFLEARDMLYAFIRTLQPAPSQAASGARPKICEGLVFLIVEDHEFQRRTIVRLLRQLGALEVQAFADGASALAAAHELRSPAILVLDLSMPPPDGVEVMRIAALERLPLAVILNSALADDQLLLPVRTARSNGATVLGAVSKPLAAAKLEPLLSQYREWRRHAHPPPLGDPAGEHRATKHDCVGELPAGSPVVP